MIFSGYHFIVFVVFLSNSFTPLKRRKNLLNEQCYLTENLLCCFVYDNMGKKIGESVALYDDILIIKSSTFFLGVPLKHVELNEKKITIKGLIEYSKAFEIGETWRRRSIKEK